MANKKQFDLYDSIGQEIKVGDCVSYLEPSSRSLSIAPVVGGTEKSLRILRLNIYKHLMAVKGGSEFRAEDTLTRPFEICIKIAPPIGKICTYKNNSMFCYGVNASALGQTLQMAIDEARSTKCVFYGTSSNNWCLLTGTEMEEIRDAGVSEGWNWHQKFILP